MLVFRENRSAAVGVAVRGVVRPVVSCIEGGHVQAHGWIEDAVAV